MQEWQTTTMRMYVAGESLQTITNAVMPYFPGETYAAVKDNRVRGFLRRTPEYKAKHRAPDTIKPTATVTGVFSDIHAPFDHPGYLPFLKDTFAQYGVNRVVCCGDIVDHHAISRHETEPCARGAYDEMDASIAHLARYTQAFPEVFAVLGNHDLIPERQAATLGIGSRYLRSLHEILCLPKSWVFAEQHVLDNVLYIHGINAGGKDGALNTAIQERMSTVIGHFHSFGGCKYAANPRSIIFGLNAGCGVDIAAYAFAYGKHAKYRPTLGCGIVFSDSYAIFVPMGAQYFRTA
jgi:predicted phosphodiesterase